MEPISVDGVEIMEARARMREANQHVQDRKDPERRILLLLTFIIIRTTTFTTKTLEQPCYLRLVSAASLLHERLDQRPPLSCDPLLPLAILCHQWNFIRDFLQNSTTWPILPRTNLFCLWVFQVPLLLLDPQSKFLITRSEQTCHLHEIL